MRKLLLAAAPCALAFSSPAVSAEDPIIIRFSRVISPDMPKGRSSEKFKVLAIAVWLWRVTMLVFLVMATYIPGLSLWPPRAFGMH